MGFNSDSEIIAVVESGVAINATGPASIPPLTAIVAFIFEFFF